MPRFLDLDLTHQIQEMESEIHRHHKLIVELRDGLEWALTMIQFDAETLDLAAEDQAQYEHYRRVLNRQVS